VRLKKLLECLHGTMLVTLVLCTLNIQITLNILAAKVDVIDILEDEEGMNENISINVKCV
jgi:hypothetical protein